MPTSLLRTVRPAVSALLVGAVLAVVAACAPATAPHGAASGAPAASAPTVDGVSLRTALARDYPSDTWPASDGGSDAVIRLLSGFDDLPASVRGTPAHVAGSAPLTAADDAVAVRINTTATAAQTARAETDAVTAASVRIADGLGSRLGPLYATALGQGRLPITAALFDRVPQGIDGTGAAKEHFGSPRPYVRLGFAGNGGRIVRSNDGSYDDLAANGSYPSGHTFRGYLAGTLLATLLPEFAPQLLARASEYGDNRIVLGFHYPLDVMGGRMAAQSVVAHRWADPRFVPLLRAASRELRDVLGADCRAAGKGGVLASCSGRSYDGLDAASARSVYTGRLDYGLPRIGDAGRDERVPADAAALLTTAFPKLDAAQRARVLELTAADSGAPLDSTAGGGASWERVDLLRAMTADATVGADGTVTVAG